MDEPCVSLREHFQRLLDERDRQYQQRFDDAKAALALALAASERRTHSLIAVISAIVAAASLVLAFFMARH